MENKNIIIIIALIIVISALAGGIVYMLLQPNVEYQTIQLSNGTTMEAPVDANASWTASPYGIKMYTAPSKKTVVTSYNSQEYPSIVGAGGFAIARDMLLNGSASVETYNNCDIRENTINGTHYYIVFVGNEITHDNIIIVSEDLDILKHMIDSIVFGPPGEAQIVEESSSAPAPAANTTNPNTYSDEDMWNAYFSGYSDGWVDSGYDSGYDSSYDYDDGYDDYNDYDYDSGQSDSSESDLV